MSSEEWSRCGFRESAAWPYRWPLSVGAALGTKLRAVQIAVGLLLLIVFWSIGKRFVLDMPNVVAGTMPEEDFDRRYVEYAWLAYLHIVPGAVYLFWRHCSSPTGSAAATTPSIDGSAGSLPLRA